MPLFTLADGRAVRYALSSPDEPQRPTVLLASLLATTGAVWDHVVPLLHAIGLRTLTYDHPGHGGSAAPKDLGSNTFESMADDVYSLLAGLASERKLSNIRLHAWVGCSMGAATGVVFATRYPGTVRKLVVCDTISASPANMGAVDAFGPRVQMVREQGTCASLLPGTRERWFGADWIAAHPDMIAWLSQLMSDTTVDGFETSVAALTSHTFDLRTIASQVAESVESVLLVVGENDADLPVTMKALADDFKKGFGTAVEGKVGFHVLPAAGHASFIDGFEEWKAVVIPFLSN
ncbi:3-oxoadipate enol-lactonase [Ophiostoma piceae UAMH 11346]|uniref:3-oxoadipate enol-lactonase n=1 Tax=Ophiostoma piceae (strain UAMH 11346) TaxID=1262450 RepID=S3C0S9_OPHP1|nr:3-oxoadipate enol-lactonase [Ophiostoma piceae UAMH 11346]